MLSSSSYKATSFTLIISKLFFFSHAQKEEQTKAPSSNHPLMELTSHRRFKRWWMSRGYIWRRRHLKHPTERTQSSAWASRVTLLSCGSARVRWGTPRCPTVAVTHPRARTALQTFIKPQSSKGNPLPTSSSTHCCTFEAWGTACWKGTSQTACTKWLIYTPEKKEKKNQYPGDRYCILVMKSDVLLLIFSTGCDFGQWFVLLRYSLIMKYKAIPS